MNPLCFLAFSEDLITDLLRFSGILQQICALESDKVKFEYSSINLWWQNVREMLLESPAALMSLLAAIMCRNHAAQYRQREVCYIFLSFIVATFLIFFRIQTMKIHHQPKKIIGNRCLKKQPNGPC